MQRNNIKRVNEGRQKQFYYGGKIDSPDAFIALSHEYSFYSLKQDPLS